MLDLPRTAPPTPPRPPQPSVLLHLSAGPHRASPACLRLPKLTVQTVRHMHATHARLTMSKPTATAPACSRRAVFVHRVLCAQRLCTATGHRSRRGLQLRPHTHVQTQVGALAFPGSARPLYLCPCKQKSWFGDCLFRQSAWSPLRPHAARPECSSPASPRFDVDVLWLLLRRQTSATCLLGRVLGSMTLTQ